MKDTLLVDRSVPSDKLSEERHAHALRHTGHLPAATGIAASIVFALTEHTCLQPQLHSTLKHVCLYSVEVCQETECDIELELICAVCGLLSLVSLQRLIQYELIFRLLLKVTVDWPRECNSIQFMRGAPLS